MPAEVKILIQGTTNADSVGETGVEKTRPTISLVRDGDIVMVVDPGVMENQQGLLDALEKEGLGPNDINVVFLTHSHLDHYRNIGMFRHAKTLEYFGLWDKETVDNWSEDFTPHIQIIHTPGHDYTGISLLVATENGTVAIVGDVFWKENYPEKPEDDAFASNPQRLRESRQMIMKMADWIVPGHGPMYANDRNAVFNDEVPLAQNKTKISVKCKKCGLEMSQNDKCQCRPYLCYHCCECGMDCYFCSCSHKKKR